MTQSRATTVLALPVIGAVLALAPLTAEAQASAPATVYKCAQTDGATAYQDYPCSGGVVVDIKADTPDPRAIERLRHAQIESDRASAQRQSSEEASALRRGESSERLEPEAVQRAADFGGYPAESVYVPPYGFYAPYVPQSAPRSKAHRRVEHRRNEPDRRVPAVIRRPR